jgi:hypothetical protein
VESHLKVVLCGFDSTGAKENTKQRPKNVVVTCTKYVPVCKNWSSLKRCHFSRERAWVLARHPDLISQDFDAPGMCCHVHSMHDGLARRWSSEVPIEAGDSRNQKSGNIMKYLEVIIHHPTGVSLSSNDSSVINHH